MQHPRVAGQGAGQGADPAQHRDHGHRDVGAVQGAGVANGVNVGGDGEDRRERLARHAATVANPGRRQRVCLDESNAEPEQLTGMLDMLTEGSHAYVALLFVGRLVSAGRPGPQTGGTGLPFRLGVQLNGLAECVPNCFGADRLDRFDPRVRVRGSPDRD
jgi:hypothetical protein